MSVQAKVGDYAWHVHHEVLYEKLTEPLQNRIDYIKSSKASSEQALRLKLIRPVKDQARLRAAAADDEKISAAWSEFDASLTAAAKAHRYQGAKSKEYDRASDTGTAAFGKLKALPRGDRIVAELHKQECEPDCPWNGHSIFGSKSA